MNRLVMFVTNGVSVIALITGSMAVILFLTTGKPITLMGGHR